jgi:hypothetical protein
VSDVSSAAAGIVLRGRLLSPPAPPRVYGAAARARRRPSPAARASTTTWTPTRATHLSADEPFGAAPSNPEGKQTSPADRTRNRSRGNVSRNLARCAASSSCTSIAHERVHSRFDNYFKCAYRCCSPEAEANARDAFRCTLSVRLEARRNFEAFERNATLNKLLDCPFYGTATAASDCLGSRKICGGREHPSTSPSPASSSTSCIDGEQSNAA